ncbi:MAG: hypothetical protein RL701_112 [Pseudomonadota bacterium]
MTSIFPFESELTSDGARYELGRLLGTGNAGAVYLAEDRETGEKIALKKLLHIDTKNVLRLKREFRSLANMHHPNLVKLYDLGRSGETWFLTMEFVDGPDLLTFLDATDAAANGNATATVHGRSQRVPAPPLDRLLPTFHQLACGVHALHQAKILHRDLKPSNVLVAQGRVVVLDFGLAREMEHSDLMVTLDGAISGTPAYMPPEQALGQHLSEVSDWYAFGAMLYQALTGRLPIDGRNANDLLRRKLEYDPVPIERLDVVVPANLAALCMRLLAREQDQRPRGEEVLAALGASDPANLQIDLRSVRTDLTLRSESQLRAAPLFGRERELGTLREAHESTRSGEPMVMHVRGASGAGKTALVEHFLEHLVVDSGGARYSDALVLRSRCYEREAMPFKALDGVMDALVRHLSQLDDFDVAHLLPADVSDLARLFPALDRLRAVQRLVATAKPRVDGVQSRTRAEHALRELFVRLAARQPVVLWIDDLQWGDLDSASVLESWLPHMTKTPLLLLFSYRSEELHTSSCLRALLGSAGSRSIARSAQQILELAPLADADVEKLCLQRLGPRGQEQPKLVARIVQEANGSPFLASQLTTLAQAQLDRKEPELRTLSMEELVVQSTALLSPDARALLNVLAVAGRPIQTQTALRAAGIQRDGSVHLHALKTLRLIRTREVSGERRLEVYHDRVREGVHASLPARDRERYYDRLLRELEVGGALDADWLHALAMGAGQRVPALRYGLIAAERASSTLAFERAAELYQTCLDLTKPAPVSGELWLKLASSLARCRRGTQAAHAYLEAAQQAEGKAAALLLRHAAMHLVRSGEFEQGEQLVDRVLAAYDQPVPTSHAGLVASIAWERTRLTLRGGRFTPRAEAEVREDLLEEVDLYATLAVDALAYDPLRATWFEARCQRLALQAGDASSLVRAFCISAVFACASGHERAAVRCEMLLAQAESMARPSGHARLERYVLAARAVSAYLLGRPAQVLEPAQRAEHLYRDDTRRDEHAEYYQLFTVLSVRIGAHAALGDFARFLSELDSCLDKARATQNQSVPLHLTVHQTLAEQLRGQTELTRARLEHERTILPPRSFGSLHVLHLIALMLAASGAGGYAWASEQIEPLWQSYRRSAVRRSAYLAVLVHTEHACMLINEHVAQNAAAAAPSLREDLAVLDRSPLQGFAGPSAQCLRARLAWLAGDRDKAVPWLRAASEVLDANGHRPEAVMARFALGRMLGDAEGELVCALALRHLLEQGVPTPLAYLQSRYPELFLSSPT